MTNIFCLASTKTSAFRKFPGTSGFVWVKKLQCLFGKDSGGLTGDITCIVDLLQDLFFVKYEILSGELETELVW